MKTQTEPINLALKLMNNRTRYSLRQAAAFIIGFALWNASSARLSSQENDQSTTVRISRAHVLYQPLALVGTTPPTEAENQVLLAELEKMKKRGLAPSVPAVEQFVANYPNSPWVPALQANLGRYYKEHGRYTEAMRQWKAAWEATRSETKGPAKQVADFTLAYWTELLVGLGSADKLMELFKQAEGRTMEAGSLQQKVNSTRSAYDRMINSTDVSFRCGIYALNSVALALKNSAYDPKQLTMASAPATGFSMSKLVELAKRAKVDLVAAQWGKGKTLVVPSVVHWKENHYAAILAQRNDSYEVLDSALGRGSHWLKLASIQAEASGYFIVPGDKIPKDWQPLSATQTDEIFGRGVIGWITDPVDSCGNGSGGGGGGGGGGGSGPNDWRTYPSAIKPPNGTCPGCGGGGGGGGSGGGGGGCCPADSGGDGDLVGPLMGHTGMPVWEVSEPYINVWLYDEPLGYQPGIGKRISFKLAYKQREDRTISDSFFSLGEKWDCSWLSYIEDDGETNGVTTARMVVPGGGERTYDLDTSGTSTVEYYSHTVLQRHADSNGDLTGFTVSYANGARDCYTNTAILESKPVAFLTSKIDPYNHTNLFVYGETNGLVLLRYVIDADGRTNTLSYTNSYHANRITGVQDPFGRHTVLQYDTNGMLTTVTDVAGLTSSFQYDANLWVTNLSTPYGNTTFEHQGEYSWLLRAVRVIDPVSGTNLYMLNQVTGPVPSGYEGAWPTDLPDSYYFDNALSWRNSFHWGPKQAVGLPEDLTSSSWYYDASLYLKARRRHWLHDNDWNISHTIAMEQAPSPDGTTDGQTTWYKYAGQGYEVLPGTESAPFLIARVIPDGTTWYTAYWRDQWGHPTNVVETYSTGFGVERLTRTNQYIYGANGIDLVQKIGPQGETELGLAYDNNHHVLRMTNAVGEVTYYTYDTAGRLASTKTPAGLTSTNIYFQTGGYTNWLQTTIDLEIGRTNSYTYTNDLAYTHTDERGLTTTNYWDNLQRRTNVSDSLGTIRYTYDKLDLVRVVDRMGFTNSFGYDAVRRKVAETNALGQYTLYNYCTCGGLDSIQDAAGNYTFFYYDNAGRHTQVVYPDNNYTVNYAYNLLGQATNVTDSAGSSVTNWFNNQGLMYAVSNAFGQVRGIAYDIHDRATSSTDANGVQVDSTYDDLGRVRTRTYPDAGVERFGYSARGLVAYTNQLGLTNFYGYDAARRKTSETNANWEQTRFTYSPAGDLLTLADGKNQTTTWYYDQYGRVTNKWDTLNNLMFSYRYDGNSRLTNLWTPAKNGITTSYRYDAGGNLTNIVYQTSPAITMRYDALNRLTNMVDGVGTTTYAYDAAGQPLTENGPWADDTVSYTYNNRLRASVSVLGPNASAWTEAYGYDAAKRLTSLTSPAGTFSYDYSTEQGVSPASLVRAITLPSGAYITNSYDNVARLLSTVLKGSDQSTINSHSYQLNAANQRTQQVFTAGNYVDYTYDKIGQLTSALGKESGGTTNRAHEQFGYTYDAAGNLHYRTNNALTQSFSVNDLNELTTASRSSTLTVAGTTTSAATNVTVNTSNAILYADYTFASTNQTLANGANTFTAIAKDSYGRSDTNTINSYLPSTNTFTYDLNGNLTGDGKRCFAYDDENQLTSVWVTNIWRSDFVYDGKMRRRIRREYTWQSAIWNLQSETHYVYDGNLVIQDRDANNLPLVTYTRGKDLSGSLEGAGGIGGLLTRTDNRQFAIGDSSAHAYYHADGNGNITYLISANQIVVARYLYGPYGNILSQSGPLADANLYRFSSKEFHSGSGLVYYLYRFYEPNLQRWLNRDPREEAGSVVLRGVKIRELRHDSPNSFLFALNDPMFYIDPYGLTDWPWPANGAVNNCSDKPVVVLINGKYYTLPAHSSTADAPGWSDDVDGVWIDGKFYKVAGGETIDTCHPPKDTCEPKSRGASSNDPPVTPPPPYKLPPLPPMPLP